VFDVLAMTGLLLWVRQARLGLRCHSRPKAVGATSGTTPQIRRYRSYPGSPRQKIRGWSDAQDRLATLSNNGQHRIAEATHVGLLADEHSFEDSVEAIGDVVQSMRSGRAGYDTVTAAYGNCSRVT
jgi:hypothetical protein